jgi:hypothetical protein
MHNKCVRLIQVSSAKDTLKITIHISAEYFTMAGNGFLVFLSCPAVTHCRIRVRKHTKARDFSHTAENIVFLVCSS